jgi:excinuclease UvrABC nuclease subunit
MPEQQLRLFAPPRPLEARLGVEFFRSLPRTPGVYLMFDSRNTPIYVGQSKNLRQRLNSYRHARPESSSRKTIRLIHAVERIVWEMCETAQAARLRENELLRLHRPKFNRVNTYPAAYCFVALETNDGGLRLRWMREPGVEGEIFGAFKTGAIHCFGALLRLIWSAQNPRRDFSECPLHLCRERPPREYAFDFFERSVRDTLIALVREYLSGRSCALLEWLRGQLPDAARTSLFQQRWHEHDLDALREFFRTGPRRNQFWQAQFALSSAIVPKEMVDDLLVQFGTGQEKEEPQEEATS